MGDTSVTVSARMDDEHVRRSAEWPLNVANAGAKGSALVNELCGRPPSVRERRLGASCARITRRRHRRDAKIADTQLVLIAHASRANMSRVAGAVVARSRVIAASDSFRIDVFSICSRIKAALSLRNGSAFLCTQCCIMRYSHVKTCVRESHKAQL